MGDQLCDTHELFSLEVELHVCRILLELLQEVLRWRPHDVVDPDHLIELIIAREQWKKRQDLKEDATDSPEIHLIAVVAICEKALGRSVPPCRNILSIGLFRVYASAGAEICELYLIIEEKNVLTTGALIFVELRFNVSMEDAISMHVVDRLQKLKHIVLNPRLR